MRSTLRRLAHLIRRQPRGPVVFRVLDLGTGHLPRNVCANLGSYEGLIAHKLPYGWLLWVPHDVDYRAASYNRDELPAEVVAIWRYAKRHWCTHVMLDADAGTIDALPTWQW